MSSSNSSHYFRSWKDKPPHDPATSLLMNEFAYSLKEFTKIASSTSVTEEYNNMYCPCPKCRNHRLVFVNVVWNHLFKYGFMHGYKIWYMHGEIESMVQHYGSTSTSGRLEEPIAEVEENLPSTV